VLIPVSDASVTAILAGRRAVPAGCVVPFPSLERFRQASDKVALLPLARAAGFGVPESAVLTSPQHAATVDLTGLAPGVLKPHRSVVSIGGSQRRLFPERFSTPDDARRQLALLPAEAFPVLAQRRIEGPGVGYFALRWKNVVVAAFAHERLRERPPSGGVSVYREAIAIDPALGAAGARLLESLGWNGVAMVECKREAATGTYYIIEVNARFWGSLQLAIDAGVDFPSLLVACALEQPVAPVPAYRVGLRSRWEWGEVDHLYLRLKLREPGESVLRALAGGLAGLVRHRPGRDRCEVLRLRDPGPFAVESLRRLGLLRGS
jgi:predicted ATP-grasp superfamily ATP-dependent carboligase